MAVLEANREAEPWHVPRLDVELTAGCDHRCAHCYNVWGAEAGDAQHGYKPGKPLGTEGMKAILTKAVTQSGCRHLTITGGEPLLRPDALDLIRHCGGLVPSLHLISNGSHIPPGVAEELVAAGVRSVQLTLLAGDRALHDRLKGAVCFDDTCRAALDLIEAGVAVQVCYVAMKENSGAGAEGGQLPLVLDLCLALGVKSLSYNRMSPTGGAIHHIARLMPTVEQIEADLGTIEIRARRYGIRVGTAMPLPPCLFRLERYPWLEVGFCSTGSSSPNLVIDVIGNVRSCNLSSELLGNLQRQEWREIMAHPYPQRFKREVPEMCRGCAHERTCQGGCKESGFATFGDRQHPEPLVWLALHPELRDALPPDQAPRPPAPAAR